ncbi:MAG: hypothetical protein U9N46_10350 [Euryarchaeota archaeon]|nr:hypothetical protein [Euryarchaeota archaeon]
MKLSVHDIDWNSMWKDAIEESNWKRKAAMPEFWDGRVDWFEELVRQSDRAGMIMKRIEVMPDYTVLDIGAGPGTVAIRDRAPFACYEGYGSKRRKNNGNE